MAYGRGIRAHQGKIARLPHLIREEVNQRLLDGQSGAEILRWLNAHEWVTKNCAPNAEGFFFNDVNLSNWRRGGHEAWKHEQRHIESVKKMSDYSIQLARANGGKISEGAAAILAGQHIEVIEQLAQLMERKEGVAPDPAQMAALAEAISTLSSSISALRTGDQNNIRLKQNDQRLDIMRQRLEQTEQALALDRDKFQRLACEKFCDWIKNDQAVEIARSGLSNSEKIEKLGPLMFPGMWRVASGGGQAKETETA